MKKITILFSLILSFTLVNQLSADTEDTVRVQIPTEYHMRSTQPGTTELFSYNTARIKKTAVVYLPYGYDKTVDKKYPVLFLMHGGGGNQSSYLGPATLPNRLCSIIDNSIMNKEIEPLIIVCALDNGGFYAELRNYLLPAIDENYNTKTGRENRAIGGFSMGAVCTWAVYLNDLDLIKNYIPMSGDSWVYGNTGGSSFPDLTAKKMTEAQHISEYSQKDYLIFAATGSADIAYKNLTPQINAMKPLTEFFTYTTKDFSEGNLIYYVVKGNSHAYEHTYEYIYNALKIFFPGQ